MRFRVIAGQHAHDDGKIYKKDEVVISNLRLDKIFVNKFEKLGPSMVSPDDDAVIVTPPPPIPTTKSTKKPTVLEPVVDAESAEPIETLKSVLGKNVTANFPAALKAGVCIFRKGALYSAAMPDEPDVPVNPKPLNSKTVEQFIAEHS